MRVDGDFTLRMIGRHTLFHLVPRPSVNKIWNWTISHSTFNEFVGRHGRELIRKRKIKAHQKPKRPRIIRLEKKDMPSGDANHFSHRLMRAATVV
jgi:hypothetical protein